MEENQNPIELDFETVIAALLDSDTPLNPRYLYRLTDLFGNELAEFKDTWSEIADWRRLALLEDLDALYKADTLLSFEAICRRAMQDPDPLVRFQAMHSLLGYDVHDLIPEFILILLGGEADELRAIAVENLGKYIYLGEIDLLPQRTHKEIEGVLLGVAKVDASALVKRKAIEALGYSSHEEVPNLIQGAFKAEDPDWVSSALLAMGRSLDERWEPVVMQMLVHPLPKIRIEAIRASGELEISKAKPHLLQYIDDHDKDIQMAAVWSLSRIGGSGLKSIFEKLLKKAEFESNAKGIEDALDYLIFNQGFDFTDGLDIDDDLDDDLDGDFEDDNGDDFWEDDEEYDD